MKTNKQKAPMNCSFDELCKITTDHKEAEDFWNIVRLLWGPQNKIKQFERNPLEATWFRKQSFPSRFSTD